MSATAKKRGGTSSSISQLDNRSRELNGKLHMHKHTQILAGISGILEVKVDSKKFNLRVGDILIIKSRTPHSTRPVLPFTNTVAIALSPTESIAQSGISVDLAEALADRQKSCVYMRREETASEEIGTIIAKISEEESKKEENYSLFIEGYKKILLGLLRRHKILDTASLDTDAISKISPALEYAEHRYAEDISLEDVSEKLNMNREYFCRYFKRATGITFVDHLNGVRVRRAGELLMTTQKSITDIAEETGFASVSYFTRVFKNITNFTPANFKNIELF